MIPTLPIEVTCPQCGAKYNAQVQSIVDVGQDPRLKSMLLRGQLNTVTCPSCGTAGMVSAPLLYHDPERELLLVFFPPSLTLTMENRERLTGSLVNALMSTLPSESRKAYLLNPRTMLTMQSLIDQILRADGITEEMIEKQRARAQLLQDMLEASDDEEQLQALIEQNKDDIDYSFLLTLSAAAEGSTSAGQGEIADKLLKLRDMLLDQLEITLPEPLPLNMARAEVVDRVLAMEDEASRRAMVMYNRPLLDYAFFQELTGRIEQAAGEEAESLRNLRTELLELVEQLDREAQAMQRAKMDLLQEALGSSDPAQLLRERKDEVDVLFLSVLAAVMHSAEDEGEEEQVQRLRAVNDAALAVLQEDLPPELRLVNDLLAAEYPQETQKLLQERRTEWNSELPALLTKLAEDLDAQERRQTAQRLRELREQVESLLSESGIEADDS
jgi:DNA polymerase III epsilon subunit-like protein